MDNREEGGGDKPHRTRRRRRSSRSSVDPRWIAPIVLVLSIVVVGIAQFGARPSLPPPTFNLFANPSAPSAQDVPVAVDEPYFVSIQGRGRVALYGAVSAVVSSEEPVQFVAQRATLAAVPIGEVTSMQLMHGTLPRPGPTTARPVESNGVITADVGVIGCHSSGFAAAIGAADLGHTVVLTCSESTPGGMLSAGQIGFVDGSPLQTWSERPGATSGQIPGNSSWSLVGGVWRTLREAIAVEMGANVTATLRYEPRVARAAFLRLVAERPQIRVLYRTDVAKVVTAADIDARVAIRSVDVVGPTSTTISAQFWVDGSDSGDLIGAAGLPYAMGVDDGGFGSNEVMDYAYRWTAIETDAGVVPAAPPPFYSVNRLDFDAALAVNWPAYKSAFQVPDGSSWAVHPFRLQNAQGRISGAPNDPIQAAGSGLPVSGLPAEKWDVNGGFNNAGSFIIARMLFTDPNVDEMFRRNALANPYGPRGTDIDHKWANLSFVTDRSGLSLADRAFLVERIKDAVKARSLGFLWYIRSGDMLTALRRQPGGENLTLRAHWSIDNQLNTVDGLPELIYQREGRRVFAEYTLLSSDVDPTYDADLRRADRSAQTPPRYFDDGVAVSDYSSDIAGTAGKPPQLFSTRWPKQAPFRSLLPRGTNALLVGSAIGAERVAYAAFRVDPARVMIGGAIAAAIDLALKSGVRNLSKLDPLSLRDTIARTGQLTAYYKWAPEWDQVKSRFRLTNLARAIQQLIARDWFPRAFDLDPFASGVAPRSDLELSGSRGAQLWDQVRDKTGAPQAAPWSTNAVAGSTTALSALTGTRVAGPATVADAVIWLAVRI